MEKRERKWQQQKSMQKTQILRRATMLACTNTNELKMKKR